MEIVKNSNNFLKISHLYELIDTKKNLFVGFDFEELVFKIINYTKSLIYRIDYYNSLTQKNKYEILPILELNSFDVALFEGRYIKVDVDLGIDDFQYCGDTPQEVWDNVIKPDLEGYLGHKIEE